MVINFLSPHLKIAGGVRIILSYANQLAINGHEVRVFVRSNNVIRRNIANWLGLSKPQWIKEFRPKVVRVLDFNSISDADVLIASDLTTAEKILNFPDSKGKKIHLIQHDEGLYHVAQALADKVFSSKVLKRICVSSWLKEILKNKYGAESELLLNTLDNNFFKPVNKTRNDNDIKILMLHHTYEWKGTEEGIKMIKDLKDKYSNIKLILFGARKENVNTFCDEYYYKPSQEKLVELYSDSDIFLCPSWDEGFGLPSLEAMACKCAVVTYDNGGSRDFAFDNKTAMVAKRKNMDDLKNKLEVLIKDSDLRKKIAQSGYEFVQTLPTPEEQTKKLEKILLD